MKIVNLKSKEDRKANGHILTISRDEALIIIGSLSTQLLRKSPNAGRAEFYTDKEEYFSIAVKEEAK